MGDEEFLDIVYVVDSSVEAQEEEHVTIRGAKGFLAVTDFESLQSIVAQELGVPREDQILVVDGDVLDSVHPSVSLRGAGITPNSEIIVRKKGKTAPESHSSSSNARKPNDKQINEVLGGNHSSMNPSLVSPHVSSVNSISSESGAQKVAREPLPSFVLSRDPFEAAAQLDELVHRCSETSGSVRQRVTNIERRFRLLSESVTQRSISR
jgi:hypothetical protein